MMDKREGKNKLNKNLETKIIDFIPLYGTWVFMERNKEKVEQHQELRTRYYIATISLVVMHWLELAIGLTAYNTLEQYLR